MPDTITHTIDARGIISRLGGPHRLYGSLIQVCRELGKKPPGYRAVQKWRDRNMIPAQWLGMVLSFKDGDGKTINLQKDHIR